MLAGKLTLNPAKSNVLIINPKLTSTTPKLENTCLNGSILSTVNWGGLGHCGEWGQKTVSFLFLQYFLKQNYFLGGNGMDCLISARCLGLAKERFFLTQFSAFFFFL